MLGVPKHQGMPGGRHPGRISIGWWIWVSAFLTHDLKIHHDFWWLDCKVYVGNLGNNDKKTELKWAFGYYGPLWSVCPGEGNGNPLLYSFLKNSMDRRVRPATIHGITESRKWLCDFFQSVWVARNPPGFAFVEFEDPRDAADAVWNLDGRTLCGCQVKMELPKGEKISQNCGPLPSWGRCLRDDLSEEEYSTLTQISKTREVSPAAGLGPFLKIGEERDYCPRREIRSCAYLSLGLVANLGQ